MSNKMQDGDAIEASNNISNSNSNSKSKSNKIVFGKRYRVDFDFGLSMNAVEDENVDVSTELSGIKGGRGREHTTSTATTTTTSASNSTGKSTDGNVLITLQFPYKAKEVLAPQRGDVVVSNGGRAEVALFSQDDKPSHFLGTYAKVSNEYVLVFNKDADSFALKPIEGMVQRLNHVAEASDESHVATTSAAILNSLKSNKNKNSKRAKTSNSNNNNNNNNNNTSTSTTAATSTTATITKSKKNKTEDTTAV